MYYISNVRSGEKAKLIGVTDTEDRVEEFLTGTQIVEYYKKHKIWVYGAGYSNKKDKISPSLLQFHKVIDNAKIKKLFKDAVKSDSDLRDVCALADYLAGAEVSSILGVLYNTIYGGETVKIEAKFIKNDWDSWLYCDPIDRLDGKSFTSIKVAKKIIAISKRSTIKELYDARRA